MNYCSTLFEESSHVFDEVALISGETGEEVSYAQMCKIVKQYAQVLINCGVTAGDKVTLHLFNSIEVICVHYAIQYIGAVSVQLDPLLQPGSIPYFLDVTEASILITHLTKERVPEDISCNIMHIQLIDEIEDSAEVEKEPFQWKSEELCAIYFTSGSTSKPKGVLLSVENYNSMSILIDAYWKKENENEKHLCFIPFSHGYGSLFIVPSAIRQRSAVVIMRSFHPLKASQLIDKYEITHLYGVPSHYQQLLRYEPLHKSLGKLKKAFCAAAKLDISVMNEWYDATGFHLSEGYGLIETSTGICFRINQTPIDTGHFGKCPPSEMVEIAISNDKGEMLSHGETGEIVVKGKSVMIGYLGIPRSEDPAFHGDWFRTGDSGYINRDGHLFMTGRIKDIINIAGIKISPYEVEAVLNSHEAVELSTVVSVEDQLYGEVVKAFVQKVSDSTITEREIIRYASERLMNFQVPKQMEFVNSFPLNNMGKVDRKQLRKLSYQ